MTACRMHGNLKSIQGNRRNSQFIHRHCHQCNRHLFSDGKEHIHLSFRRFLINIPCHSDQFIRIFPHCGQNDNHVISFSVLFYTAAGNIKDTFFICNRCTAKFLDNQHCFTSSIISLQEREDSHIFPFLFCLQ